MLNMCLKIFCKYLKCNRDEKINLLYCNNQTCPNNSMHTGACKLKPECLSIIGLCTLMIRPNLTDNRSILCIHGHKCGVFINWLYSKTQVKWPLSKRQKIGFQDNYGFMQVKSIAECSKGSIL